MVELIFPTITDNPFAVFEAWYAAAQEVIAKDPNAMTVATCGDDRWPSARTVLLKEHGPEGFTFFTNYTSTKSEDLTENARAELLFYWPDLDAQIRIAGRVEKTGEAESDAYFHSRHPRSRVGAWASDQSSPLESYDALMAEMARCEASYGGDENNIPRPPHWGGWRVVPESIEFWQAEENRLHKRMRFVRDDDWRGSWLNP